ncbi:EamA family transporter [bacterium]|nr:EamA family transporter [bacterium]
MNNKQKAYIQLHIAVFLFGFTAILGKLITLKELALVWNRLWIAVIGLILIPGVIQGIRKIKWQNLLKFAGIGVLVSLHWLTFYGSIKIGDNASLTLACLATTTLFASVLEPLITKSKFQLIELLIGLLVIVGIIFLTQLGSAYYKAIIVGLISAFLAALFSVLNKKYISNQNSISVSVIELSAGFAFLSLAYPLLVQYFPVEHWYPKESDWLYILTLGLLCTSLAYVISLNALKELSAFTINLSINLEPVYGIILAILLLNEDRDLNTPFYIGTAIILSAVILHPVLLKLQKRKRKTVISN